MISLQAKSSFNVFFHSNVLEIKVYYNFILHLIKESRMRKMTLSLVTAFLSSALAMAGGGVTPVKEPIVEIPEMSVSSFQEGLYVGLGLSGVSTRESQHDFWADITEDPADSGQLDRTGDINFLIGYDINEYLAVEGRYMASIAHEDALEHSAWGIYAKPQYPLSDVIKIYALLGYGDVKAKAINGSIIDLNESGFQWGIGGSYNITEHIAVFADFVSLANDAKGAFSAPNVDIDSEAITVGITYKF